MSCDNGLTVGVYEKALAELNHQQRRAVDQLDGPVLVVAGPGTGKTQLLSTRVAHILKTTDTKASNILCLTFTNKAAVNMKQRIIEVTGPAAARIVASTFHSFAAEIMNLYRDYFWNSASLTVAPQSIQLDVIESLVAQLPLDHPLALKFAGQYTLLSDIQQAIGLAKEASLTPDKLRAILELNIAYIDVIEESMVEICQQRLSTNNIYDFADRINQLPKQKVDKQIYPLMSLSTVVAESLAEAVAKDEGSGKCSHTSRWKNRWLQTVEGKKGMFKERARIDWWLKLADVYEDYRHQLHQRNYYDYSDMLIEVISQLEQNPEMLADVQERFDYVMIDEFQDTTPAQLRLAYLAAEHHTAESRPNLMVVGDDDQTIFKFSGAQLNNMIGFRRNYPATKTVVLTENYRSTQAILDTARKIIEQAETRLIDSDTSLNKDLTAADPPTVGKIKSVAYASQELQISQVAHRIQSQYTPDISVAVLARNHDSLIRMAGVLQQLAVPVRYEQSSNILEHEIVNQVYLICRLTLAIQSGDKDEVDALMHRIVRWPVWGIEAGKLWSLALSKDSRDWLSLMVDSADAQLQRLSNWLMVMSTKSSSQPLAITVEQILGLRESNKFVSPIRDHYVRQHSNDINQYFHGLSAIQLLRALVHEFSVNREPTVEELVRFFEINKQNGLIVADESPFITGSKAVQLLTVHKAKGLEFDQVYIIDAIEDNWRPRPGRRKPPANLPLQPQGDDFDDYIRLLYVAATRAKSSLFISSYYQDHSGKDVAISSIVQAALPPQKKAEKNRQQLISVLEENLHWPTLSGGQEKQMLKDRLQTYNLAVTHLMNFLDVTKGGPSYFKERNLLLLPEAKTPSLSYGTAIHAALDEAQLLVNRGKFSLKDIQEAYSRSLGAEQMPAVEFKRYLVKGQRTLAQFFEKLKYQLPKGSLSELRLKDVTVGQARLGGKLDRVDLETTETRIIDYKTGAPLVSFSSQDKTKALKAHKHKLQLVFYALLANHDERLAKSKVTGQMVYVDADTKQRLVLSYQPTPDDIERLSKLVQVVWHKIINLDLPAVNNYSRDLEGIRLFEQDLLDRKV